MKPIRLAALALVAITIAACSLTKVAYNNAGFMLTYMVDDYFDLNGPQEDWVRERLGRAIAWHRQQELPEYERFLRETIARTEKPVFAAADARFVSEGLRAYYKRMVEHLLPDAADLMLQLDAEQVAAFEKKFSDESRKLTRETVAPDERERVEKRTKKMIEQIETYTGRLDGAQRDLVAGRVHFMTDIAAQRVADRKIRQQRLVELVRAKTPKPQMMSGLRTLLVDTDAWRDPAYAALLKKREGEVIELVVQLAATLTPEQKNNVRKKLRSYLTDVNSLMAMK